MSGVGVNGTDVEIAHEVMGNDVVVRISKRECEVLRVTLLDAVKTMSTAKLQTYADRKSDFYVPIGKVVVGQAGQHIHTLYCSFCGKSQHEVRKMVAGPKVFICDECADMIADIFGNKAG